jgi:hypothetical protein
MKNEINQYIDVNNNLNDNINNVLDDLLDEPTVSEPYRRGESQYDQPYDNGLLHPPNANLDNFIIFTIQVHY